MRGRRLTTALRAISVVLMAISVVLSVWLILGSFVTYTPEVTATEIQNIYIERITWIGEAICALQVAALVALIVSEK